MALEDAKNPVKGVSGPGKFSTRTDLPASQNYGDRAQMASDIAGAPTASTPDVRGVTNTQMKDAVSQGMPSQAQSPTTELFAPSNRPNEPITNGVDIGPGMGSSALQMAKSGQKLSDALVKMLPFDTTGEIAVLYQDALSRGN
jgi:hypothetical protein